jgi:acyl-CoA synthetase (AMP-forming)/AMP-acid ligase II
MFEQILKRNAAFFPDKVAIIDGNEKITFRELYLRSNQLANGLLNLGIKKGDRVGIMARNGHEYLELFFAMAKIGAVGVSVNWRLKGKELSYIINDSEAHLLIFYEEFSDVVNSVKPELKTIQNYIVIGEADDAPMGYDALLEKSSNEAPCADVFESDEFIIMYTSGTTGLPKGAVLTHRNFFVNNLQEFLAFPIRPNDVFLNCGVFFHMPLVFSISFVMVGATNVIMDNFTPEKALTLIQDERVTKMMSVPTMINLILQYPQNRSFDLGTLKGIVYGGMPISAQSLKDANDLFRCEFWQCYGSTESGMISFLFPEDHVLNGEQGKAGRLASAGTCNFLSQMKLVNDLNEEVAVGEVGEIVVKGESVMKHYWNRPEETREVLRDGWYRTGDLARMDDEGYVYLFDRKKDTIISGGENIYPAEIEEVLCSHPAVQMAAVIGIPDKRWGESVKAIVTLKEGGKVTEEEIITFCKDRMAGYKKPKSVDFVDSIPTTATGKILRKDLRENYWQGYDRRVH